MNNHALSPELREAFHQGAELRRREEGQYIRRLWGILQGVESNDPQAVDEYERYGDFFELEISLREAHQPGIDRWFSRLSVGEVEFGNPDISNELIFFDENGDNSIPPVFDVEMDGDWWEKEEGTDAKLCIKVLDEMGLTGEVKWLPNREHLKIVASKREKNLQEMLSLVKSAHGLTFLKRLVGRAKFLSAQAAYGIKDKKNPKKVVFGNGLDYRRYAEVMNACAKKACLLKGFNKGASLLSQLYYAEERGWAETIAKKLNSWLKEKLPGFKVFPIKVYEKTLKEGEDIYEHGGRCGEFHCDTPQTIPCKCQGGLLSTGEVCPLCGGYGEGYPHELREALAFLKIEHHRLSRISNPIVQGWKMAPEEIEAWLLKKDTTETLNYSSEAFIKLNELFNFSYDKEEEKVYVYSM